MNPSPYLYYFQFGDFEVIGSSPEMLVKQQGKRVFTCPIAGTRPRGKTVEEDEALHRELLADEKERAEHVMLVDLARNDMGRISEFGTVKVTMSCTSYPWWREGKRAAIIRLICCHPSFRLER